MVRLGVACLLGKCTPPCMAPSSPAGHSHALLAGSCLSPRSYRKKDSTVAKVQCVVGCGTVYGTTLWKGALDESSATRTMSSVQQHTTRLRSGCMRTIRVQRTPRGKGEKGRQGVRGSHRQSPRASRKAHGKGGFADTKRSGPLLPVRPTITTGFGAGCFTPQQLHARTGPMHRGKGGNRGEGMHGDARARRTLWAGVHVARGALATGEEGPVAAAPSPHRWG